MADFELRLNPDLDAKALAKTYAEDNFICIENLFPADTAEAIFQVLLKNTPWYNVHSDAAGKHKYYTQAEWQALSPDQKKQTISSVYQKAREGFSYLYYVYPMVDNYVDGLDPDLPLHAITEFVNSDEFRGFVKEVTNEPSVIKLDAQATYYAPGHFLNTHNDMGVNAERRAAYVMGFSKNWRTDWGGQLLFLDERGNTTSGVNPKFNSLTMFKVPRTHIVTQVSSFAGGPRLSITGWLRDDPKE
ncbi:MAG: proline hydroxylase [Acidimicrobiales bacterium]|nr:proline hydroxylase [Hyphomonadaceae bacterium]RZV42927.1 MAG: proline hydroxylase [Acidimicrobiales bacterium]